MHAHLFCKASVYKLFSVLFLASYCLLYYADTVPLNLPLLFYNYASIIGESLPMP